MTNDISDKDRKDWNKFINSKEKVLAVGDNLRTDIKGANNVNVDSIFISSGVHRNEFKNENELKDLMNKYEVNSKYFQEIFSW